MTRPLVSAIIAAHNGMDHIQECLKSLFGQKYPHLEVILVDNASTDGMADYVELCFPQVKVFRSSVNLAYGKGNNLGASLAKGDYLLFLNHDTFVSPGFLVELVNAIQREPGIGLAQSKIMMASAPERIDSIGAYLTMTGFWYHPEHGQRDRFGDSEPVEILGTCGACLLVRRSLFESLRGFDPDFVIYFDDADLSWRACLLGFRTVMVPSSVIYHWGGSTTRRLPSSFTVFHSFKNRLCSLIKLLSFRDLLLVLPVHLALCLGGVVLYFLRLKPENGMAIFRALFWNAAQLGETLRKRRKVRDSLPDKHRRMYQDLVASLPIGYFMRTSVSYVSKW